MLPLARGAGVSWRSPRDAGLDGTAACPARERAGLILAPLAFAALWLAPLELEPPAHRLAAIMGAVVVLWVTEAIPMAMTAFLGVAAAVALGVAPAAVAFAPFADPLIFLFVGTFMLAQAIFFHGLDRRFAFAILSLPGVGDRPGRVLVAYAAVACAISMWISNTATTAMMFPIGISLLAALEARSDGARAARRLRHGAAAVELVRGVGRRARHAGRHAAEPDRDRLHPPRARRRAAVLLAGWRSACRVRPGAARVPAVRPGAERRTRGHAARRRGELLRPRARASSGRGRAARRTRCSRSPRRCSSGCCPALVALFAGEDAPAYRELSAALPESVVALFGAALLFVLPTNLAPPRVHPALARGGEDRLVDRLPLRRRDRARHARVQDGPRRRARALRSRACSALHSSFGLIALSTALAAVLSETTSNTAAANMVVPVVIAVARSAGVDPVLPALAATMGASLGFMLPVSTPCNAIVYGSGRIPLTRMMRHGVRPRPGRDRADRRAS